MRRGRSRGLEIKRGKNSKEHEKPTLLGSIFELPGSGLFSMSQITVIGNKEALVEGCKGIAEYCQTLIRLNMGQMGLKFTGRELTIRNISEECVAVSGCIISIEFIT